MLMRSILWTLVLLTSFWLSGCSNMSRKDGPPSFNVDASKIPDAVPKAEPLSKYGNKPYYTVFGKRYYVMRTSKNYEEQGIASWYGTKFHSRHTSSGERYNMLAMTAAHKSLPLPTYVEVTNLKNGRKVIVKVNDRGPFESNRLIDLSYVAAKKLGMLGHGTAKVDVKAIDPNAIPPTAFIAKNHLPTSVTKQHLALHHSAHKPLHQLSIARNQVYLQVGAFRHRAHAETLKKRLVALQYAPVNIHAGKNMYRVHLGPIKDFATANRLSKRLKTVGIHSKQVTL